MELRPSAFGGTRVIVLVPERYVAERPQPVPARRGAGPLDVVPRSSGPRRNDADPVAVALAQQEGRLPTRSRGYAMADVIALVDVQPDRVADPVVNRVADRVTDAVTHPGAGPNAVPYADAVTHPGMGPNAVPYADASADPCVDAGTGSGDPLPQRVRQASLAAGLKEPAGEDYTPPPRPRRSGATIGAFQRQSRKARTTSQPTTED